jgi:pantoate--beta-alanine ligase
MGALHEGHLSLIRRARKLADARKTRGSVVVSLFVNPAQFGPQEDFSRYPRPLKRDLQLCREAGVDAVFLPEATAFYASDASVWISEERLSAGLCGASRPGHFRGVCTVVAKLFNTLGPDIAVFGKKDAQQLAVIRRMVRDLNFPVRIVGVETHREPDGLAMSSRNRFLSPEERTQAVVLSQALRKAALLAKTEKRAGKPTAQGMAQKAARLQAAITAHLCTAPLAEMDYVEVCDAATLAAPTAKTARLLAAVAVKFGNTRLIDNGEMAV